MDQFHDDVMLHQIAVGKGCGVTPSHPALALTPREMSYKQQRPVFPPSRSYQVNVEDEIPLLRIHVVSARGLPRSAGAVGLARARGMPDPYVVVKFNGEKVSYGLAALANSPYGEGAAAASPADWKIFAMLLCALLNRYTQQSWVLQSRTNSITTELLYISQGCARPAMRYEAS